MTASRSLRAATIAVLVLLLAQFLIGMAVNLFVRIPGNHPGARPPEYALLVMAIVARRRDPIIAAVVGLFAVVAAGFNGASFLNYDEDFSSMLMSAAFAVAMGLRARPVHGPARRLTARARSRSTRTRRRILPDGDFGISVTNSTSRTRLYGATRSVTNAISSSAVAAAFACTTTNAFGISPASASGFGTTATSATAGWVSSTASSSAGATWYPLYFTSSFSRSTT